MAPATVNFTAEAKVIDAAGRNASPTSNVTVASGARPGGPAAQPWWSSVNLPALVAVAVASSVVGAIAALVVGRRRARPDAATETHAPPDSST